MRKLIVFNNVTLDGCFVDAASSMNWARAGMDDPEYAAFVSENASNEGALVFGRVTYELMASYWPTPAALEQNPTVAAGMNRMPKVVFSRTLKRAAWNNTRLLVGDPVDEMRRLKSEPGPGLCILGSGSIVAQLAPAGLIDEYQLIVNPVALGQGRSLFQGIPAPLNFRLADSRTFKNGKVYLSYTPV
jgi:dihydrofolate reductase